MRKLLTLVAVGALLSACDGSDFVTDVAPDSRFAPDSPVMLVTESGVWADVVLDWTQGVRYDGTCVTEVRSDPTEALLAPDFDPADASGNWFSLGMFTTFSDACDRADPVHGHVTVGFEVDGSPVMVGGDIVMVAEATFDRDDYPLESVAVEGHNGGTWYDLGTATNKAEDGVFDLALTGDMCYDAIRLTNTTTMEDYEAQLGDDIDTEYAGSVLMPDGFDVDAVGASEICVMEEEGCTRTQGYWKTHSDQGPAPYDAEGWGNLGDFDGDTAYEEEEESLYGHGTWLEIFNTAPRGDAWYQLAHQFMAAYLNVQNGASTTDLGSALDDAATILSSYAPGELSGADAEGAKALAETLTDYNEGIIGPGHCDDVEGEDDEE